MEVIKNNFGLLIWIFGIIISLVLLATSAAGWAGLFIVIIVFGGISPAIVRIIKIHKNR